jgi:nucleoside-diphosphate-sugar epimerase
MDLAGRTIAVSGATGFLGGSVARALAARGARVRAVVRSPRKAEPLSAMGMEVATANLLDPASLAQAFRGVDAIASVAALYVLEPRPWSEFFAANVMGPQNVCDAARDAGVRRIVHVSTCGVYRLGPSALWRSFAEDSPCYGARDRGWTWAYYVTKAMGETVARNVASDYDLQLTVVRPAGIFGPGDQQALPKLAWLARLPIAALPRFFLPMSYVDDVAAGVVSALATDAAVGRTYNLSNDTIGLVEWMRTWRRVTGRGPRVIPLPSPIGIRYSWERAARELGYANRPLAEALRLSLAPSTDGG